MRHGMRVFQNRDFRYFWGTRVLGFLAIEMMVTTVGWQVYRITGRELDLGLVGLAQFAPFAILFLVSGVVADRLPRMYIIRACIAVQTICAFGLFLLTITGDDHFIYILLLLLVFGTSRAFQGPAQQAILPNLVSKSDLPNAIAWSASGFQMARVIGPTISGILIVIGVQFNQDETWVYSVVFLLFLLASWMAWNVRASSQIVSRDPITLANLFAGLKFIKSRKVILGAISLDLFAVLFGGALALLPVYAKDILNVGAEGFGLLRSAFTLGALFGALYLTQRPIRYRAGLKLLIAVAGFGTGAIVFGLSNIFWLSLFALLVMGLCDSVSVFVRQNMVQIITPDSMRGRVSAVSSVFTGASNELGEFESGITAHWWGTVPAVVFGGAVTVLVALSFAYIFPQLRQVNSLDSDDLVRKYRDPPAVSNN
ncbi:MAG: MFS transporter [Rhodospirillaceae bacterium]|nr:MFS transporter [Rhodospirillaceae bacterium]|tara:strand:+ start:846 stop:2123 length:1278 start_codon:yes stop_codon:yes gene_type:complete